MKKYTTAKPYIRKMIDVSTTHITESDAAKLRAKDCPIVSYPYEYGDRVIPSRDTNEITALKIFGFSEAFIDLYKLARRNKWDLLLDRDGIEYSDLPKFEW